MKLNQPLALNEQGKRQNQEDSIFPEKGKATAEQRFFLVCDGMGGHENGEVASATVCEAFAEVLSEIPPEKFGQAAFEQSLSHAFDRLDEKDSGSTGKKMGTTLTFLHLNNNQAFMAHIGDSRIYHLRRNANGNAEIVFRSNDHSLVNDLLQAGFITEQEAASHPKKNVITRAMQPHEERPHADIHATSDVQAGDLFLLCSDGVLESVNDETLLKIVAENNNPENILANIETLCASGSKDNFSAYLIAVEEGIEATEVPTTPIIESNIDDTQTEHIYRQQTTKMPKKKEKKKNNTLLLWLIALLLLAIVGLLSYKLLLNKNTTRHDAPPIHLERGRG